MPGGAPARGRLSVAVTAAPAAAVAGIPRVPRETVPATFAMLPPDLSYCLDHEVQTGGLGADERAFVDLYMPDAVAWFDAVADEGASFPARLRERHRAWRAAADPLDVMGLDWAGLGGLRWLVDECADGVLSLPGVPEEPADGDLMRCLESAGTVPVPVLLAAEVAARCSEDIARWGAEAFHAARGRAATLYERHRDDIARRDADARTLVQARRDAAEAPGRPAKATGGRRAAKLARRALARSYGLLAGLAGRPRASAWLAGDTVTVEGNRFDFRLRVRDPNAVGHGALDVSVTDKHGILLAQLCVYVPETPALDQVAALVLHVISGEEDEILRKANVIISTEAAHADPAFEDVFGPKREAALREVAELIAGLGEEAKRIAGLTAAGRVLARRVVEGPLAPLRDVLGGDGVAGLFPVLSTGRV